MNGEFFAHIAHSLEQITGSLFYILPALGVIGTLLGVIVLSLFRLDKPLWWLSLGGLSSSLLLTGLSAWPDQQPGFDGLLMMDGPARYLQVLIVVGAIFSLLALRFRQAHHPQTRPELALIYLLTITLGAWFLAASQHLLMMYLAIEMMSLPAYLWTAWQKKKATAAEAGMKYVLFGGFSSALMIYGLSWWYGLAGSFDLANLSLVATDPALTGPATGILIMVLLGLLFKTGAFPLHFWIPDVYQGAAYPVAAFFAVVPKAASLLMMLRLVFSLTESAVGANIQLFLLFIGLITMSWGNLAALAQRNTPRLLAYSAIAHTGYLLVGVALGSVFGASAVLFYLGIYLLMKLGAFFVASTLDDQSGTSAWRNWSGVASDFPGLTIALVIFLIALTGLPPTAGFVGKWYLILALGEQNTVFPDFLPWLAIAVVVINTVISLYYYMKIPARMVFSQRNLADISPKKIPLYWGVTLGILCLPLLIGGVWGFDEVLNFLNRILWK
ncbi:MAG: NADH-quinone oxidoreductase subunit N [Bacteroidota bacterium]